MSKVGYEEIQAADKICNEEGNYYQSNDGVHELDEAQIQNRVDIWVLVETLQHFVEPIYIKKLEQPWKTGKSE